MRRRLSHLAVLGFLSSILITEAPAGATPIAVVGETSTENQADSTRLRVMIETDAGGDPDDEQSLVRFLLYANEWDVEGIISNRRTARDGENRNRLRTGLEIVQAQVEAYAKCYTRLVEHDPRFPSPDQLLKKTVAGYSDSDAAVRLIIEAVDRPDPRPLWFANWGTDHGSDPSNLRRALDQIQRERGAEGYARFKDRIRLSSDDQFGEHTKSIAPPFRLWVDTFRPPVDGKRWYHRFSAITAKAGGFDIEQDVRTGHGPLGALYPTNTTHPQKEGDSMTFLYLVPTGMNDPDEPTWGSWAGRYGIREEYPDRQCFWANQVDHWNNTAHRDNTLIRWAADLQNDFRARMDWCVKPPAEANHAPSARLNGDSTKRILHISSPPSSTVTLDASETSDPDGHPFTYEWLYYREAGTYSQDIELAAARSPRTTVKLPADAAGKSIHILLIVRDRGEPPLASYRRVVITGKAATNSPQ